ncbi:hypothetical protein KBD08_00795 [Candidatus Babeliales bacterium]|nr:hypothetical protein [Candidatus Babeliales bacterium]
MNFKKYVLLVLCCVASAGVIRSSASLNKYGERVVPLSALQQEDMQALLLNDTWLNDVQTNLDLYLQMLDMQQHINLFQIGLSYRNYKMLKDQLNYKLTESIYCPIFYKNSDTQVARDKAEKKIQAIQKLLDYVTLLEYQTKEQDFERLEHQRLLRDVNAVVLRAYAKRILDEVDEQLLQAIINREPTMRDYIVDMIEDLDDDYKESFEEQINEARDGLLYYMDHSGFNFNMSPEYLRALTEETVDDVSVEAQHE